MSAPDRGRGTGPPGDEEGLSAPAKPNPESSVTTTDSTNHNSLPERRADFLAYVEACCSGLSGKLFVPIGYGPQWTDGGKYDHTDFQGKKNFDYPTEKLDAYLDWLLTQSEIADVFICPNLMYKDRVPGSCVGAMVAHADWDGTLDDSEAVLEKVRELGGFAVASGRPGHIHAYLPLAETVHPARAAALCKAFQAVLPPGSDKSKHAVNDLLRPPGTFNHKTVRDTGSPAPVYFLIRPGKSR